MEFCSYCPGWSEMAQSQLTTTTISGVQAILLSQPPDVRSFRLADCAMDAMLTPVTCMDTPDEFLENLNTLGGRRWRITRSGVRDQPDQHGETPSLLKIRKLAGHKLSLGHPDGVQWHNLSSLLLLPPGFKQSSHLSFWSNWITHMVSHSVARLECSSMISAHCNLRLLEIWLSSVSQDGLNLLTSRSACLGLPKFWDYRREPPRPANDKIFMIMKSGEELKWSLCSVARLECSGTISALQPPPPGFKHFFCLSLLRHIHHTQLIFVYLVEMGFPHAGQAGLKLLTS
ncbi:hypothetical protein AAY473_007610 [Plecturocebus cupreus]